MPPGNGGGYGRQSRSVDPAHFAMNPRNDIPRSAFDVRFMHKTSHAAGYLIPFYVDEVLPGDSVRGELSALIRIATPIVPIMDNLIVETFFFYVPERLIWTNFQRFMGEQLTTTDFTEFLFPQVDIVSGEEVSSATTPSLFDYMGITMNNNAESELFVRASWSRAYNLIWNDWFRDQDLQNPVVVDVDDGPDLAADYVPLRRGKRHDYFTTCRPWPAKPGVVQQFQSLNMGPNSTTSGNQWGVQSVNFNPQAGAPVSGFGVLASDPSTGAGAAIRQTGRRDFTPAQMYTMGNMRVAADATNSYPDIRVLVNDIRTAVLVQHLIEANARGGTRYTEIIRNLFGVISPDARLQRPEYLGGGKTFVNIHPLAQTSATGATGTTTVLGELSGVGVAVIGGHRFSQSFTEHGVLLGLVSIRADLTYQSGVERMWFRRNRYDFYVPQLANLGEQAVLMQEIRCVGAAGTSGVPTDQTVFGYQERWAEYKWHPSRTSAGLRSPTGQLDMWHLAQDLSSFASPVSLNSAFIQENPPIARALQVSTFEDYQFIADYLMDVRYVRPMPVYSLPGVGGRL